MFKMEPKGTKSWEKIQNFLLKQFSENLLTKVDSAVVVLAIN